MVVVLRSFEWDCTDYSEQVVVDLQVAVVPDCYRGYFVPVHCNLLCYLLLVQVVGNHCSYQQYYQQYFQLHGQLALI